MLLRLEDIHTHYGKSHILQGVSMEIRKGEIVGLLGRNGVGKTTTLNTVVGFVKPSKGRLIFNDRDFTSYPCHKISRMGIAYVPQGRHLFPQMTVLENLKTGMLYATGGDGLDRVFDLFPNLKRLLDQKAGSLSGGEQQAVAISRAILKNPEILLLDEPTTGLMPLFVNSLLEIVRRLNEEGMTILLVEEKVPFVLSLSHRIYFMVKGRIEHGAAKEDLVERPEVFVDYLGVRP
ncbi:ABC transporter ATP-binding protein [Desulfomonile tiedjei]|uniref:ABC-type branched-chain amino acid transport systems, ATPase component n=1 Tax=Desulfomonile tiedjei (strain ATCC 49306 / DSM 6799 / DCB-1) TaxID=706587 RepID=I4C821_DESTA|nr:ABC transporter ATP-binding protein [Desulfomonile tiedjei]AFM25712.1 ABC-type branched-chain amino acid transport systems, ATPase component [Desulfomonile tiedjei DSM 6799]